MDHDDKHRCQAGRDGSLQRGPHIRGQSGQSAALSIILVSIVAIVTIGLSIQVGGC